MRQVYDLTAEPRGDLLRRLLTAVAQRSSCVLMILRDDLGLSEAGTSLLSSLEPHLIERGRSSSWPGTTLFEHEATTLRFRPSPAVLDQLFSSAEGLYEWQQPTLPEDLAFLREDGSAVLASICHERDAYLEVDEEEYQSLALAIPELSAVARLRQATGGGL